MKKTMQAIGIALLFFAGIFIPVRVFYTQKIALVLSSSISAFVLITYLIINRKKNVHIMTDKIIQCPFCGKELDAAFIDRDLAMSRPCPHCGKIIDNSMIQK